MASPEAVGHIRVWTCCSSRAALSAVLIRNTAPKPIGQDAALPGHASTPGTSGGARAALGPFLGVFVGAEPGAAVAPLVEEMTAWADREPTVRNRGAVHIERLAEGFRF